MSRLAFLNGLRLHKDSILLHNNDSYPSAFQLSVLALEEIGKAFVLEEYVFRYHENPGDKTADEMKMWMKALSSHTSKQKWFSRHFEDIYGPRMSRIVRDTWSGKLDEMKQNAIYVGLTKTGKKMDPKGRIVNPADRVSIKNSEEHITRVNDFLIELIEGCRRGVTSVDTDELDNALTLGLGTELEALWTPRSPSSIRRLKNIREFNIDLD